MVGEHPPRQLIGPLLALNALLVVPFAAFVDWHGDRDVILLHVASAATIVIGSWCIFDLFTHGSAAAVSTGAALTPISAVVFSSLLISGAVTWLQTAGALVVSVAVLAALGTAFGTLGRRRALTTVVTAAVLNGLLIVLTKLLTNRGLGVAEIYLARTAVASSVWLALAPPRDLPLRSLPTLLTRSSFQTGYFALIILAVARGSPATVQTLASTTPLMILIGTAAVRRRRPPLRLVLASCAVILGVALATS
jgi:drug/metabolite transporter (DMT)-like permease